jgi:catechol 2,3-dioxygenase-like lactoylglutathione lyase family enzyme
MPPLSKMASEPQLRGVVETALYVQDLGRSREFYCRVMKLEPMVSDDRFCALRIGQQVLLLFLKGAGTASSPAPERSVPPHVGSGQLHVAFAVSKEELATWEEVLRDEGIVIESRAGWPGGGNSLYFRDPDGHLIELVTPGTWPNY